MIDDSCACSLFEDFPFLAFERFHGDGAGGAPIGAESAPNAFFFVFDNGSGLAGLELRSGDAVALLDESVVTGVAVDLHEIDETQAVLGTDVDATVAEDTFRSIEDGVDLAFEAAEALSAALLFMKSQLDFSNADAAIGWEHGHLLARSGEEAFGHFPVRQDAEAALDGLFGFAAEIKMNGPRA